MTNSKRLFYILSGLIIVLMFRSINAQEDSIFKLPLNKIMELRIVTPIKIEQTLPDAPAIITVIDRQEIDLNNYQSVAEALQNVPGFDVITDHFQPNVGVRGISGGLRSYSRIIKVMIDGQQVANQSTGDNYLDGSLIPMDAINSIEVIKGPNSALYGADAYLGVVNIRTIEGTELATCKARVEGGAIQSNVSYNGSLVLAKKNKEISYLFSGSIGNYDRSGLMPIDLSDFDTFKNYGVSSKNDFSRPFSLFGKIERKDLKTGDLKLDVSYRRTEAFGEFQDWSVLTHKNRISVYNGYARLLNSKKINDKLLSIVSISYTNGAPNKNESLSTGGENTVKRDYAFEGCDAKAEFVYNLNDENTITFGADFTNSTHNHQNFYSLTNGGDTIKHISLSIASNPASIMKEFNNYGVYIQTISNPKLIEKLGITSGIRFDKHNLFKENLNYRLGLVYKISNKSFAKILYGTSFRAPSSSQLYTNYLRLGGIYGNPDLLPEKAQILDIQFATIIKKNFFLNVSLFNNLTKNKIEIILPLNSTTPSMQPQNKSDIKSYGIETELTYTIERTNIRLSHAYQKSTFFIERQMLNPGERYEGLTSLYPVNTFKLQVNHNVKDLIRVSLTGRYTGCRVASDVNTRLLGKEAYAFEFQKYLDERYTLDPFNLFDLNISSVRFKLHKKYETRLNFKIQNLFNERYALPGFKDNYDIPGLGRTIMFGVVQHF